MDTILLIDAYNAFHRANVSFGPKEESDKPTYVMVYNFFRSLRVLVEQFNPNKVFLCTEGSKCFRYGIFPEYKANRIIKHSSKNQSDVDDFNRQSGIILDLIQLLPIITVKADGYEADDVIASLAESLKDEAVIILSNDSDFVQLLQKGYKNLRLYSPIKKEYVEAPEYPYTVWKSLAGDKSDSIPGLVGPKTAEKLLANPDKLKEFFDSEEHRANFNLNKELIELRIVDDDKLQFTEYNVNFAQLKEEFTRMEFNSILDDKSWNKFVDTFKDVR